MVLATTNTNDVVEEGEWCRGKISHPSLTQLEYLT